MDHKQANNKLLIVLIFALSVVPMALAAWLNANPGVLNVGKSNKGELIIPPVTTSLDDFGGFDEFSSANLHELKGRWLLVSVIANPQCEAHCLEAILATRQLRLMLGKDLSRTRRVVLVNAGLAAEPARQLWLKDSLLPRLAGLNTPQGQQRRQQLLRPEQQLDAALIDELTAGGDRALVLQSDLIRVKPSPRLLQKLAAVGGGLADGMLLLIDPLGNVMMRYPPGFDPYQVKSDLHHLLKVSQIG